MEGVRLQFDVKWRNLGKKSMATHYRIEGDSSVAIRVCLERVRYKIGELWF